MSCEIRKRLVRLSLQPAWPSGSGSVASSRSVVVVVVELCRRRCSAGPPPRLFPTSSGDREMVLLAQRQSAGLWLGKAATHCSHHLPL